MPRRRDGQPSPVFQPQGGQCAVLEFVPLFDLGRAGHTGHVDLRWEMPAVEQDRPVLDQAEVIGGQNVDSAGFGNDDIGAGDGCVGRRCHKAIQMRLQPPHRVGLAHRYLREGMAEAGCDPLSAGAVAEDRDPLAVGRAVGQPHVGLEHALAHGVAVLPELFDRAVVDHQDRHGELLAQRFQPHPARGGFFRPAAQARVGGLEIQREQVSAVVEQQVGPRLQHPREQGRVPRRIGGLFGFDPDPGSAQILDRFRLGAAEVARGDDVRPARAQGHEQCDGLGFEVDTGANGNPGKGAGLAEFIGDLAEQGAVVGDPLDTASVSGGHGSASVPVPAAAC